MIFYLKVFPSKPLRWINFALATALILELVEETMVVCLQCTPLRKAWTFGTPGKCLNLGSFFYASFGTRLVTDLVLFCLPIPSLWRLKVPKRKRAGIITILSLGLLFVIF